MSIQALLVDCHPWLIALPLSSVERVLTAEDAGLNPAAQDATVSQPDGAWLVRPLARRGDCRFGLP